MQKSRQKFTLKIPSANSKVNRAKAQSRPSGILFAQANGKLCFMQQIYHLQQKQLAPRRLRQGKKRAPKSAFHDRNFHNVGLAAFFTTQIQVV
jgi:hypothetical protein